MWCASKIPPARWSNSRARISREGKEAWQQEVETQGAILRKEDGGWGAAGVSGQPWEFPFSEFATFFVAIGAANMRRRNCKMSTSGAEASVRRQIPHLIS